MAKASGSKHPLCQHLDSLVDELRQRIPAALDDFDEDGIHKARVTTRRLKAAIELLEPSLDSVHAKPFARLGRKLRRRLGPLRDLDVLLGHLDRIDSDKLQPAVAWLREHLKSQRDESRKAVKSKKPPSRLLAELGTWWGVRPDVIDAEDSIPELLRTAVAGHLTQFKQLAERLGAGTDPHDLRIAGKALRYTLELAQAQGFKVGAPLLRSFKRMQDLLGSWHDQVVLAERAMLSSVEAELPLHDAALQRNVLALADHAMRRAQRELMRFKALWSQRGDELSRTIQAALDIELTSPKTDPDPVRSEIPPVPAAPAEASPPTA